MKKQMKLCLFALLAILMVATLAVCVSAAETTAGATDAYYSAETASGTAYYSTIAEAIAAVKDGGTITVLKNASEAGIILSDGDEKSYTITGSAVGTTLTLTENTQYNTTNPYYLYMRTGTVTLKNLTLVSGEGATASGRSLIYLQNKQTTSQPKRSTHVGHLILDNVVSTIETQYGIWIHRLCDLTVKGEGTNIKGGTDNVIRVNNNAVYSNLTIEGGTLTGVVYLNPNTVTYTDYATNFTMTGGQVDSISVSADGATPNLHVNIYPDATVLGDITHVGTISGVLGMMTGDTTYVSGKHMYKVTPAMAGYPTCYFATLTEALAALKGECTIELLSDVAEEAPSLNVPYVYTINGKGYTMTLTPASRKWGTASANNTAFHICDGAPTIQSITLALASGTTANSMMYIQNKYRSVPKVNITLNNVVAEYASTYGIWLHQEATLTVKGAGTRITGGTTDMFRMQGGSYRSILNIEGGTFTSGGYYGVEMLGVGGTLNITGGSFEDTRTDAPTDAYWILTRAKVNINITGGRLTSTHGGVAYIYRKAAGTEDSAGTTINIGGTAYLESSNTDWDQVIKIVATDVSLTIGGTATVRQTKSGSYAIGTNSATNGISLTVKDSATIEHMADSMAIAIYGEGGTVTVSGGVLKSAGGAPLGLYRSITVNISGGTFVRTGKEDGVIFLSEAINVTFNLTGTFTVKNGSYAGALLTSTTDTKGATATFNTDGKTFDMGNKSLVKSYGGTINLVGGSFSTTATYFFHVLGAKATVTVEGVTATTPNTMFYMNSGAAGCTMTVKSGTYAASRMMYSYSSAGTQVYNFEGGKYTSTATASKSYPFLHPNLYGTTLNISGGEFYANQHNTYLISLNNGGHASFETNGSAVKTVNITGGKFDGAQAWVFANSGVNMTIKNATFTDVNNTLTTFGFRIRTNATYDGEKSKFTLSNSSFTTHEDSKTPIFWLEEESVTINSGTFEAERIFMLSRTASDVGRAYTLTVNGGVFNVRGDKAIVLPNLYGNNGIDNAVPGTITFNGGTFVMGENGAAVVYGNTGTLTALNIKDITVYTKNSHTAVYGQLAQNNLYFFLDTMPSLVVPVGAYAKYAGEIYNVYHVSPSTNSSFDVANAESALEGASVYVSTNATVSGIRFYTVLSATAISKLKAMSYTTISFGTVIAPVDYVIKAGDFTIAALEKLTGISGAKYVKIPAVSSVRDTNGDGIPESYSAALVKLKPANYTRGFAAVSYVEIDGTVYYGSFDTTTNVRSIREISKKIISTSAYSADQLSALLTFAGFAPDASGAISTNWNSGRIGTDGAIVSANGYVYSDLIHIEKAGTVVTFSDTDGSFAGADTLVISQYDANGTHLGYADDYAGNDAAIAYQYGSTTTYSYVSSFDNEYIRICCSAGSATVYAEESYAMGTLKSDTARFNDYMLSKLAYAGGYSENLERLDVVAIGDSYFNDPAVIPNMWIEQLARKYQMNLYNYGISGSTMANDSSSPSNPMVLRVKGTAQKQAGTGITIEIPQTPNPNVDIVFLEGGRNDLSKSASIGEVSLTNKDEATMCGAINVMIEHLRYLYPNAMIVGMSCWGYNATYTVNTTAGNVSMTQKAFSRQIYEIYLMNGIVAFDSSDIELSGVDVNDPNFREYHTKAFGDISHLSAYGAACFLPRIEAFVAEKYKAFAAK